MKRALSLILVLAMVLCLVPFSAFAEGEVWGFGGIYSDGTITLNADNNHEASALYTAPDAGTVTFTINVLTEGVEGVNVYINSSETAYAGEEISVAADGTVDVTVSSDNGIDCEVSISHNFMTLPGTEGNPRYLSSNNTTVIVPANSEVWYNLYGAGYIVSVSQGLEDAGVDFTVYHKNSDTTYAPDAENWIYDAQFNGVGTRFGGADAIKITNNLDVPMYYLVKMIVPEGHMDNPMPIYFVDEAIEGEVMAGSQGFYYTYTPYQDGTLTVTVGATDAEGTACGWTYTVNNLTSYAYGDNQWSDSDPVVNPAVIEVSANDEIQIIVNTYDPADPYNAPAGKVSVTLGFEAAPEEPDVPVVTEPEVAEYNDEIMGLNAAIAAAAADYATDNVVKTVTLVDNFDDATATIIIEPGVLLNLGAYSITARNVIGLSGSFITGTAPSKTGDGLDGGKIIVGRNNLSLSGEAYAVSNGSMLPVWYNGQYIFTLSQINFPAANQGGLNVDTATDNGYAKFVFKANFTNWVKNNLFAVNGTSEHAVNMIISVSWVQDGINVKQEFTFPTDMQSAGMSSTLYGDLINCNNYENLAFNVIYVSDSGATMTSATYNYADYIS